MATVSVTWFCFRALYTDRHTHTHTEHTHTNTAQHTLCKWWRETTNTFLWPIKCLPAYSHRRRGRDARARVCVRVHCLCDIAKTKKLTKCTETLSHRSNWNASAVCNCFRTYSRIKWKWRRRRWRRFDDASPHFMRSHLFIFSFAVLLRIRLLCAHHLNGMRVETRNWTTNNAGCQTIENEIENCDCTINRINHMVEPNKHTLMRMLAVPNGQRSDAKEQQRLAWLLFILLLFFRYGLEHDSTKLEITVAMD